jgi:hypothetical protein
MGSAWWQVELPELSVYADGRAIGQGPVPAIYPGQALPNLLVQQLEPEAVRALEDAALAAGVADTTDPGRPPIADALTTRFTVVSGSHTYARDVYALSASAPSGSGLTPDQQAARAKLQDLLSRLEDVVSPQSREPYRPTAVALLARPWTDPGDGLNHPAATWPGPALPGKPLRTRPDSGCVTVTGNAATAVLDAAATANLLTPWATPDGAQWWVGFRPLLPDESGCTDLED